MLSQIAYLDAKNRVFGVVKQDFWHDLLLDTQALISVPLSQCIAF